MKRHELFLVLTVGFTMAVHAQMLPQPPNTTVHIDRNVAATAPGVLIGSGIAFPDQRTSMPATDSAGNEIVWRQVRKNADDRGGTHAFYRQYLRARSTEAELVGSEVGLHYDASGALWLLSGHQFTSVTVGNRAAFGAEDAVKRVLVRLQHHPGFRPEMLPNTAPQIQWRIDNSTLKIVATPNGFRYAWFTYASDVEGADYQVVMDAQSEEILAIGRQSLTSNCAPSGPWGTWQNVSATGIPVRANDLPGVQRSVRANVAGDRPYPFTHEAFDTSGGNTSILQETANPAFKCNASATRAYTLVPLMTDAGVPVYRDRPEQPEWRGSAAGDAMYHTKLTLSAFASLGRAGWDGGNGDANLVLESTYGGIPRDSAFFRMSGGGDPRLPPTPFVGIARTQNYYSSAAALDVIAHEWGHGVIRTSANFPCVTSASVECQLHEGFADVIGQTVEKLKQPAGTGLEKSSDWTLHEDNGTSGYARGALDDGEGAGYPWVGLNGYTFWFNDTVHRDDQPAIATGHARGNMLNVVLRLLVEGGTNPVCARSSAYSGCNQSVPALGLTKATRILFDTIQWYAPSTARWEDLATYASAAAFDRYSRCPYKYYDASIEQNAVDKAFGAIGYPRLTSAYTCP